MRYPGRIRPNAVSDMTEHIDLSATVRDMMELDHLPIEHGRSLRPYLERGRIEPRDHIFSEYLENEEAYIRSDRWKFIYCSGKRGRRDGYVLIDPTPGRYKILFDLQADPGEFHNVVKQHPEVVEQLETTMLERFRQTHPEARSEPRGAGREEALDWYLRPPDA
jgi:choline-sulfatase